MFIRILGPVEVSTGQTIVPVNGALTKTVLAILVSNNGRSLTKAQLVDMTWGDDPPATVGNSLANAIHAIRQAVGAEMLETVSGGYRLVVPPEQTDIGRFQQLLQQAPQLPPAERVPVLTEALGLWTGDCFAGAYSRYVLEHTSDSLYEQKWQAELDLLTSRISIGDKVEPSEVRSLINIRPDHQGAWALLGDAHASVGDPQGGLSAVRMAIDSLRESGLLPSPELRRSELRLLLPSTDSEDLALGSARPMVGRVTELKRLIGRVLAAADGNLTLSVVTGEAGIGKSTIVNSIVEMAGLRHHILGCDSSRGLRTGLAASLGVEANDLVRRLRTLANNDELLLVIEDVHRDDGAVMVLNDLATALAGSPLAVVVTTRPTATTDQLRRLAVLNKGTVVPIGGLTVDDFVALAPRMPRAELEAKVDELGGNPLLVMTALANPDSAVDLTDFVRSELVSLNPTERLVAQILALQPDGVPIDQLAATSGLAVEELLDTLEPLQSSGLVTQQPLGLGDGRLSMQIRHHLIADAVLDAMALSDRPRLHGRIRDTVLGGDDGRSQPKRLTLAAHHAHAAAATGNDTDLVLASRLCHRAGLAAFEHGDWPQAETMHRRALEGADLVGVAHVGRCHLELGRSLFQLGSLEARTEFLEAARVASRHGYSDLLADVVMAWSRGIFSQGGAVNQELVQLARRALSHDQPICVRARLLAVEASELTFSHQWAERFALADQALADAEDCDDATKAFVLSHRQLTIAAATTTDDRIAAAEALLEVAQRLGDPHIRFQAVFQRAGPALLEGDVELLDRLLAEADSLADDLGTRAYKWLTRQSLSGQAFLRGDIARAKELSTDAFKLTVDSHQETEANFMHQGQMLQIRRVEEGLDAVLPFLAQVGGDRTTGFTIPGLLAWAGDGETAARALTDDGIIDLDDLPANFLQRASWQNLALIAAASGNEDLAGQLVDRFLIRPTDLGITVVAHSCGHHWAAICYRTMGRWSDAVAHHEAAIGLHDKRCHPLLELESRRELAFTLVAAGVGRHGQWHRDRLVDEVNSQAESLGAKGLEIGP